MHHASAGSDLLRKHCSCHICHSMATLKQHKAIGEDLWKARTDKIVGFP